jgi:hypothetical protein
MKMILELFLKNQIRDFMRTFYQVYAVNISLSSVINGQFTISDTAQLNQFTNIQILKDRATNVHNYELRMTCLHICAR